MQGIPKVSVITLSYNQVKYIKDCMDGVLTQKVDFPIEYIVHDDASDDGTSEIISEYANLYPDIIKPILQSENQYSKHHSFSKILHECIRYAKGEYIAICEGDDYWIDNFKLKKQVEILDSSPDYGLIYTKVKNYSQNLGKYTGIGGGKNETYEDFLIRNTIPTLTTLFRKNLFLSYILDEEPETKNWKSGDYPLWLYIATHSKVKFLNEITGVYRILSESACHTQSIKKKYEFSKNAFEIKRYYIDKYGGGQTTEFLNRFSKRESESLLRYAIVLDEKRIVQEIKASSRTRKKNIEERFLISYPRVSRIILNFLYRIKGMY